MPLYVYRCDRGHETEAQVPLADFDATGTIACSCGGDARRVVCAPVLRGLTVPGGEAWSNGGRWTGALAAESEAVAGARARIEADAVPTGRLRGRTLAYMREHELARSLGMNAEAQAIEHGLGQLNAEADRIRTKQPKVVGRLRDGRPIIKETTTRQSSTGREAHVIYRAA